MDFDIGINGNLESCLGWAVQYPVCMVMVSNNGLNPAPTYSSFDALIATGAEQELLYDGKTDFFEALKIFTKKKDWYFGHLGYDLKNQIEKLSSNNRDELGFPDGYFFAPENLVTIAGKQATIVKQKDKLDFLTGLGSRASFHDTGHPISKLPGCKLSTAEYLETIHNIKRHIQRGDLFEVNFCYEYFLDHTAIDPVQVFLDINAYSPMPFAAFYKLKDRYLLCFSPERFIRKQGMKIISQPIKGTVKRGIDAQSDRELMQFLSKDLKEKTENIMITDLVRNDLSRTAQPNSVQVEELCQVYPFRHVFQMISTVSSLMDPLFHPVDVIKNAFPMGSMTGTPKVSAMQLTEKYESTKRGIYSGSLGYFTPEMDFDFNVVIRSIGYNNIEKYLNFMVGSAITSRSVPEKELEECQLKAKALYQWLQNAKACKTHSN
jgi:para-aminobenzoate synthetase component I